MVTKKHLLLFICISIASFMTFASSDIQVMENARYEFSKGHFEKAIQLYTVIPASSDFWLDALEERAWSYTRLSQYEKALADLQSITSPVWSSQVGPETYMLSTFVSLKICAYKDVVKKINTFKKRMLPRVGFLEKLITEPLTKDFLALSEKLKNGQVTMMSLGKDAEKYPRYFFRDVILQKNLNSKNLQDTEKRLKQLAHEDLKEIELNLKKMKIIEVELIQKVLLAESNEKVKSSDLKFSSEDRRHKLIFPVTDDEVWIDEVGHFQVKADQCASTSRRSL